MIITKFLFVKKLLGQRTPSTKEYWYQPKNICERLIMDYFSIRAYKNFFCFNRFQIVIKFKHYTYFDVYLPLNLHCIIVNLRKQHFCCYFCFSTDYV